MIGGWPLKRIYGIAGIVILTLFAFVKLWVIPHWPSPPENSFQPLDSVKSLWISSDVPQVGAIVRLTFANKEHTLVKQTSYLDASLAALYHPTDGAVSNEDLTIKNKASASLGLKFLIKGNPGANATIDGAESITLKVSGERVVQWVSLMDLQNFLRKFDGHGAISPTVHDLYVAINQAGDDERKSGAVTPYWVITKVFTGKSVEYTTTSSGGITAGATCGGQAKPCVVPAVNFNTSLKMGNDKQDVVNGSDRPIFVVIKPVTTNRLQVVRIEDDVRAPAVISD